MSIYEASAFVCLMLYLLIALALSLVAAAPLTYPGPLQTHAAFEPLYALLNLTPNYAGELPGAVMQAARLLGLSPLDAWKSVHLLAFVLGAPGAYLLGRAWRGNAAGLVTAAVYTFLPYRLMTAYVRGDAGEAFFWGVAPWLFIAPVAWRANRARLAVALVAALGAALVLWSASVAEAPDPARATAYVFQLFSAQWGYGNRGDWLDAVPLQIGFAPIGLGVAALVLRRGRGAYLLAALAAVCAALSVAPLSAWWPWSVLLNVPWQALGAAGLALALLSGALAADMDDERLPLLAGVVLAAVLASYPYLAARGIDYTPDRFSRATFALTPDTDRADLVDALYSAPLQAGATLTVTLLWQPRTAFSTDYQVFVHVVDLNGKLWAQRDRPPLDGLRPTTSWQIGELLRDPYPLTIPANSPLGLRVEAGLYRIDNGARLRTADGGDSAIITPAPGGTR